MRQAGDKRQGLGRVLLGEVGKDLRAMIRDEEGWTGPSPGLAGWALGRRGWGVGELEHSPSAPRQPTSSRSWPHLASSSTTRRQPPPPALELRAALKLGGWAPEGFKGSLDSCAQQAQSSPEPCRWFTVESQLLDKRPLAPSTGVSASTIQWLAPCGQP